MTEPNTTKIDKLLIQLLSGAQDRDADTPKRREKGAARFDKAYVGIVAYVSKLEKDLAAYKASSALRLALAKQQNATIRGRNAMLKKQDKEIARLASRVVAFGNPSGRVDCKRCLAALARQKAKAARSNTESSAGRIPRTPGR